MRAQARAWWRAQAMKAQAKDQVRAQAMRAQVRAGAVSRAVARALQFIGFLGNEKIVNTRYNFQLLNF